MYVDFLNKFVSYFYRKLAVSRLSKRDALLIKEALARHDALVLSFKWNCGSLLLNVAASKSNSPIYQLGHELDVIRDSCSELLMLYKHYFPDRVPVLD